MNTSIILSNCLSDVTHFLQKARVVYPLASAPLSRNQFCSGSTGGRAVKKANRSYTEWNSTMSNISEAGINAHMH